jgi:6-phosphogluconolactonase
MALISAPDLRLVSETLADDVAAILRQAVRERGRATLAVPGGTTPREFLACLGLRDLPWSRIIVVPTDERDVAPDDLRSNERMIRECLPLALDGFVPLRASGGSLDDAAIKLGSRVASLLPFDAVVVGMGADTHIASLFPGDARLGPRGEAASQAVMASYPTSLEPRLSLSPLCLVAARWIALLIAGEQKRAVLTRALQTADPVSNPVCLLFEGEISPRVYFTE